MYEEITGSMPKEVRKKAEGILKGSSSEKNSYANICDLFSPPHHMAEILPSQIDLKLFKEYPLELCQKLHIIPISRMDIYLTCASYTPWDKNLLREFRAIMYDSIRMVCVTKSAFNHLASYTSMALNTHSLKDTISPVNDVIISQRPSGRDAVKNMLYEAYNAGASDIHIEPNDSRVVVKFRINGELCVQEPIHNADRKAFLSAVKDFALLPLNETKNLADCRFSHCVLPNKTLDFRVAKIPASGEHENFVLRILDSEKAANTSLPFSGKMLDDFLECLNAESGMIVLTGPTGSGKTTTLYSAMSTLNLASLNVRTIEDPIEYRLPKAIQTQIDPKNGITFASTLRGMLRADPDVIMVGEIRDSETAELAAAASNTGHLVLTTLHTKSAAGVISRLEDLRLTRGEIQEAASLVVSQRLFPKLCPHCKREMQITELQTQIFEQYNLKAPESVFERHGCPICLNTGIMARSPVFEFLRFTPDIRELTASGASIDKIAAESAKTYPPMIVSALKSVGEGEFSFDVVYNFAR